MIELDNKKTNSPTFLLPSLLTLLISLSCTSSTTQTPVVSTPPVEVRPNYINAADTLPISPTRSQGSAPFDVLPQIVRHGQITNIIADPHGRFFIVRDYDGILTLHDAITGQIKATHRPYVQRHAMIAPSFNLAGNKLSFSLVFGDDGYDITNILWDLETDQMKIVNQVHQYGLESFQMATMDPSGERIYTIMSVNDETDEIISNRIELYNSSTKRLINQSEWFSSMIHSIQLSPSGASLITWVEEEHTVRFHDPNTLQIKAIAESDQEPRFRPQGGQLLTTTEEGINVLDPINADLLGHIDMDGEVNRLQYAQDGSCLIAEQDQTALLIEASTLEILHTASIQSRSYNHASNLVILSACRGFYELANDIILHKPGLPLEGEVYIQIDESQIGLLPTEGDSVGRGSIALIQNETALAVGLNADVLVFSISDKHKIAHIRGGAREHSIWENNWSPQSNQLYSVGRGFFDIWNHQHMQASLCEGPGTVHTSSNHRTYLAVQSYEDDAFYLCRPEDNQKVNINLLATTKQSPVILGTNEEGELILWNVNTWSEVATLQTEDVLCSDIACGLLASMSSDGTYVALTEEDSGFVDIFETRHGRKIKSISIDDLDQAINLLGFDKRNSLLMTTNHTLSIVPKTSQRPRLVIRLDDSLRFHHQHNGGKIYGHQYVIARPFHQSASSIIYDASTGRQILNTNHISENEIHIHETQTEGIFILQMTDHIEFFIASSAQRINPSIHGQIFSVSDRHFTICTDEQIFVRQISNPALPGIRFGSCGFAQQILLRPDAQAILIREPTRTTIRTADGHEVNLRALRSLDETWPTAINERGLFSVPDALAPNTCIREQGPMITAICRPALNHPQRVQAAHSDIFPH